MNFDDLKYQEDLDEFQSPDPSEVPATFEQKQYLATLWDSNAVNVLEEKEYRQMELWMNGNLSFQDASMIIDRLLKAQPDEVPRGEKNLANWIKRNKLDLNDLGFEYDAEDYGSK